MSKIYEALEQAAKQRASDSASPQVRTGGPQPVPVRPQVMAPSPVQELRLTSGPLPFDLHLEKMMSELYSSIASMLPGPKGKTIEFVSANRGAGTSTLIREFAKVAAVRMKKSVLLLDADPQTPTQVKKFELEQEYGWDTALGEGRQIEPIVHAVADSSLSVSQLLMQRSDQPVLFDSPQFGRMLKRLSESFDLILIDAPPLNDFAEGTTLAKNADGVILVVEAEKTRWQVAQSARDRIELAGGTVLGSVLNKRRYHIPSFIYRWL